MTGVLEGLDALFERLDARLGLFDLVSVLVNSGVLVGFQDVPEDDFEGAGELLEKVGVLLLALEVLVVVFEEASEKIYICRSTASSSKTVLLEMLSLVRCSSS